MNIQSKKQNPATGSVVGFLYSLSICLSLIPQGGEEEDVADGGAVGEKHDEAVDADAETAGGGHAVFQGFQEVFIHGMGFVVALGFLPNLGFKAVPAGQWGRSVR